MQFDDFLREACPPLDLQWRKYRRRAARHRVLARMKELGIADFYTYLEHLRSHVEEASGFADRARVTVSRFFRDRDCWQEFAGTHIPAALERKPLSPTFRALCVGCCGGEEPYTLSILWNDLVTPAFPRRLLRVTAIDMDDASLERASRGLYGAASLREVPPDVRRRWFRREDGGWVVSDEIRRSVVFRKMNFTCDPLPGGQDLVLCRYLAFTYYRGERRLNAAGKIADTLKPGGLLFIGKKEGLGPAERDLFDPLSESAGVFRKA